VKEWQQYSSIEEYYKKEKAKDIERQRQELDLKKHFAKSKALLEQVDINELEK